MHRFTQAYIPPNLGGGTLFGGAIKIRNAIEACLIFGLAFLLGKVLYAFLPYLIATSIWLIIGISFSFLALVGINGEPLSIFVLNIINYSNTRNFVTLRPPQKPLEKKPQKKSRAEKLLDRVFVGGYSGKHSKKR